MIQSTILGLIQGLTEFIPISSSGHLVIAREIFGIEDLGISFDAFLHLSTLLAVIIYFRKDILSIIKETKKNKNFIKQIIIAMIPAGIAGFLLEDTIDSYFRDLLWVSVFMILVSMLFILSEKFYTIKIEKKDLKNITWKDSLFIGLAQVFALLPGASRSGITITAGMFRSLRRIDATKFSFLMSIVIILAASGKGMISLFIEPEITLDDTLPILWSSIIAFVSGYLSIKFLMNFLKKHKLYIFSIYLFILGVILFVFDLYK